MNSWVYKDNEINTIDDMPKGTIGFLYCISCKHDGRRYLGKKLITKAGTKQVNKIKKKIRVESDWLDYYSSSPELIGLINLYKKENFKREILLFAKSKSELNYFEESSQYRLCVLESDNWINGNIRSRIFAKNVIKHDLEALNNTISVLNSTPLGIPTLITNINDNIKEKLKVWLCTLQGKRLRDFKSKFTITYYELIKELENNNILFSDDNIDEIFYRIKNQKYDIVNCKYCEKEITFKKGKGFLKYCCTSCASLDRSNETRSGFVNHEGWEKSRNTLFEKYGERHTSKIPEIHSKMQRNRYRTYDLVSPSGKGYKVQGYERYIIPVLWNTYLENDIIIDRKSIPKIIYYSDIDNKEHRYYADAYIKSKNLIVEVKSDYTIKDTTLKYKLQGALSCGYNVKVYLYHKGQITEFDYEELF